MQVKEITLNQFDTHIINGDVPFVMRRTSICDMNELKLGLQTSTAGNTGVENFKFDTQDICMDLRKRLEDIGCVFINNRFWEHNRGHVTRWHYDGDGVQVINICLSGSKKFDFSPPSSAITFPFTHIAMLEPTVIQSVVINKGDILFFPSFWYHRVTCLQDDTITYNICTTREVHPLPREAANICYHRMLRTKMGTHPQFKDIRCNNMLPIVPEISLAVGSGAVVYYILPRPLKGSVIPLLISTVMYCSLFERNGNSTHGVLTANIIPFTVGVLVMSAIYTWYSRS